jgi:hypothetical protein
VRAGGVYDRPHLIHALFQGQAGRIGDRVGQSGATLVEHDEAPAGRQPAQEAGMGRPCPCRFHVGYESRNEDKIPWAVAQDLIGDMAIATDRVTGNRCLI